MGKGYDRHKELTFKLMKENALKRFEAGESIDDIMNSIERSDFDSEEQREIRTALKLHACSSPKTE